VCSDSQCSSQTFALLGGERLRLYDRPRLSLLPRETPRSAERLPPLCLGYLSDERERSRDLDIDRDADRGVIERDRDRDAMSLSSILNQVGQLTGDESYMSVLYDQLIC
jgi:hypothetical protein